MPFTYSIDRDRGRIDAVAEGTITFQDVLSLLAIQKEQGIVGLPELIDATAAAPTFTPEEVRRIVEQLRSLGGEGPLGAAAVLVGSDYAYGMLRMLEMLSSGVCAVRPFRSRVEAEEWLDSQASASGPRPAV